MKPASMTCRTLEHRVRENRLDGLQTDGAGQRQSGAGRAGLSGAMFSTKRSDNENTNIQNMLKSLHLKKSDLKISQNTDATVIRRHKKL